ncbi:MAG TPA: phage tail protein, partial [Novosphingobium sp.]|nr:phage tail protein [Novosphingobium sp.]
MATLLFTAIGTIFGGPLGGALGALAGSQVDSAIFGGSSSIQGPRLQDLTVSTSSYGSALARQFGTMRVAGSIIWATDLAEHSSTSGGGKNQPSVTSYSYTSSFAVAVSSRPIVGVGRIWADGNLLRGTAGDLKVGGSVRIHTGQYDQAIDPLIASAEGSSTCPAFRGLAYVVFEDLELANFGNRIPSLSVEVIADNGTLSLASLFDGVLDDVDADVPLTGILGYSCEGTFANTLAKFQPLFPMLCDAGGSMLTITRQRLQTAPIVLGEPAVSSSSSDFGGAAGFTRQRTPDTTNTPRVLRYYDAALDYQPGTQRAPGRATTGQQRTLELPASLTATNAFQLIAQANRDNGWAQDTLSWRCAELDPAVAPGAVVTVPGLAGQWRVTDWEWRETGVELTLRRLAPTISGTAGAVSAGTGKGAADVTVGATALAAYELPW